MWDRSVFDLIYHEQTKQIDIKYHFIWNVVVKGKVVVGKISLAQHSSNIVAKPIPLTKLELCWSSGTCEGWTPIKGVGRTCCPCWHLKNKKKQKRTHETPYGKWERIFKKRLKRNAWRRAAIPEEKTSTKAKRKLRFLNMKIPILKCEDCSVV